MMNMSTDALKAAFQFTDDDLAQNRAGRLSPTQQTRMAKSRRGGQIVNLVMGAIFIVGLVIIAIVVLPGSLAPQPSTSSAVPPGIIVLVLAVVVVIIALTLLRTRRRLTRLTGDVFTVEGPANTRVRAFAEETVVAVTFRLSIGKTTFVLSDQQQLDAFEDGKPYRAYYVKGTLPIIVAAEPA